MKRRDRLVRQARELGFRVEFLPFCEDTETPGFLGQILGVVCEERKAIKIKIARRTEKQICDTLAHEIDHVLGNEENGKVMHGPSDGICGGRRNGWLEIGEGNR
jgi:hypothetical protein